MSYLSQTGLISPQADKAMWSTCLREIAASMRETSARENFNRESRSWWLKAALALFSGFFLFVGVKTGDYSALFWFMLGAGVSDLLCGRHRFYESKIAEQKVIREWVVSKALMLAVWVKAFVFSASHFSGSRKIVAGLDLELVCHQFLHRAFLHPSSKTLTLAH